MRETCTLDHLKDYCGRKPGSTSGFPFSPKFLAFEVRGRIFAVLYVEESPVKVTLKSDPEESRLLRERYPSVVDPARYFDERTWNVLTCDGTVPDEEVADLLDASYDIVVDGLKRSDKEALQRAGSR